MDIESIFAHYATQPEPARRWRLHQLQDRPAAGDLYRRLAFVARVQEDGLLADEALAVQLDLTARFRRLAAGVPGAPALAPVPIFEPAANLAPGTPLEGLALALAAGPGLEVRLERELARTRRPYPLALGLAPHPRSQWALRQAIETHATAHPAMGLALAHLHGRSAGRLVSQLALDASGPLRISLFRSLPNHPERPWTTAFRELADHEDHWVGVASIGALARLGTPRALRRLLQLARKLRTRAARLEVLSAVERFASPAGTELAVELTACSDAAVRVRALDVLLARADDAPVEQVLAREPATPEPDGGAMRLAAGARLGRAGALAALGELLRSPTRALRLGAATALAHVPDRAARALLAGAVERESSAVVASAALRALGAQASARVLSTALARGGAIAVCAAELLLARAPERPAEVFEAVTSHPEPGPGLLAVTAAVAATGAREALALLDAPLAGTGPGARWAAQALYALGSAAPRRLLTAAAASADPAVQARGAAAQLLAGDARGAAQLAALLQDDATRPRAALAVLDLATLLPAVRGLPRFADAAALIPAPVPQRGPSGMRSQSDDALTPLWPVDPAPAAPPAEPPAPGDRSDPPPPAPVAPPDPARPLAASPVLAVPRPPPPGPGAPPARRGLVPAALLCLAVVVGLGVAVRERGLESRRERPALSTGTDPDLAFFPVALSRAGYSGQGGATRAAGPGDVVRPGDAIATAAGGAASLTSRNSSRLTLRGASRVELGAGPRRTVRAEGRVELDWLEPSPLVLELGDARLEGPRLHVALDADTVELKAGAGRWAAGGAARDVTAPCTLARQEAR